MTGEALPDLAHRLNISDKGFGSPMHDSLIVKVFPHAFLPWIKYPWLSPFLIAM